MCLSTILMFQRVMVVWKGNVVDVALKFIESLVYFKLRFQMLPKNLETLLPYSGKFSQGLYFAFFMI